MMMSPHMDMRDLSRMSGMAEAPGVSQGFHQYQSAQDHSKFPDTVPPPFPPFPQSHAEEQGVIGMNPGAGAPGFGGRGPCMDQR
jgi:hypothetical protein